MVAVEGLKSITTYQVPSGMTRDRDGFAFSGENFQERVSVKYKDEDCRKSPGGTKRVGKSWRSLVSCEGFGSIRNMVKTLFRGLCFFEAQELLPKELGNFENAQGSGSALLLLLPALKGGEPV